MVDPEHWTCPHGHGTLVRNDDNGLHHTCQVCRGFAVTIWLFDELLADGVGAGIWRSSQSATADGDPCPLCGQRLRPVDPPTPTDDGGRIEVCRNDEVVWVDATVIPLLPVHPGLSTAGIAAPEPTRCPTCGAPISDVLDDRCHYCRAHIRRAEESAGPELAQAEEAARMAQRWPEDLVHEAIERQGLNESGGLLGRLFGH